MRLYLLQIREGDPNYSNCDTLQSVVVRAWDEEEARALADAHHVTCAGYKPVSSGFLDAARSKCEVLSADGESGVICGDFYEP
jgi:hypothetical protein